MNEIISLFIDAAIRDFLRRCNGSDGYGDHTPEYAAAVVYVQGDSNER